MAVDGNEIGILIGSDLIGSQRGATITRSAEMMDVSDKTSDEAKFLPGKQTMNIECSAFYVAADTAYGALVDAFEDGQSVTVVWSDNANGLTPTTVKTASAYVTSLSVDAPAHGPAEISISLQATGAVTPQED
jgi:TP901-1 family phage major tail protein